MGIELAVAGIGAAAGLAGASMQSDAAESAANTTAGASKYAADMQWKQYEQNRKDMAPWRNVGQSGLYELARRLGLGSVRKPTVTKDTFDWKGYLDKNPNLRERSGSSSTSPYQYDSQGYMDAASAGSRTAGAPLRNPMANTYIDDYGNQLYLSGRVPAGATQRAPEPYTDAELRDIAWNDFVKGGGLEAKFEEGYNSGADYSPYMTRDRFDWQAYLAKHPEISQGMPDKSGGNPNLAGTHGMSDTDYNQLLSDRAWQAYQKNQDDFTWLSGSKPDLESSEAGGEYGQLLRRFSMRDFEADPGYQFRLSEGLKAVQGSAAARGGFFSGNTGIALNKYGQGMASDEYANAYNRYNQDMSNIYNRLAGISGTGQTAAQQVASLGANAANAAGGYTMQGALAQAGYQNQAGNSWANAGRGIGNQLMGAYGAYQQRSLYDDIMNQYGTMGAQYGAGSQYSSGLFGNGVSGSGMYDNYGDLVGQ